MTGLFKVKVVTLKQFPLVDVCFKARLYDVNKQNYV